MASSQESQRRKRAWRKPRQEIGPGVVHQDVNKDTQSGCKARRINRTILKDTASPELVTTDIPSTVECSASSEGIMCASSEDVTCASSEDVTCASSEAVACANSDNVTVGMCDVSVSSGSAMTRGGVGTPFIIDGSVMEGGGQILRNSVALSCLLSRPITVTNIRAGRGNPGLRPQHLTGIELLTEMCQGKLVGGGIGSTEITLSPQAIQAGHFTADPRTAGSICLLLQAVLPCLLFAPKSSKVTLKGGTNVDMAPPIDYAIKVFMPIAARFGAQFDCKIARRGFYPKGHGEVVIATPTGPVPYLSAVTMTDTGSLVGIKIHTFVAGAVSMNACHQMVAGARKVLERQCPGVKIEVEEVQETRESAFGNSSGIMIVAETSTGCLLAGSANGRKSDRPDVTGRTAAEELVRGVRSGGCVDEHLQDQLIILMALARGCSTIRTGPLTLHTQTAMHIAQLLTKAKFKTERVADEKNEVNLIHCEGIGLENKHSQELV